MITFPSAKINIGLNILGERKDGFHEIETVLYPIGFADILEVIPHQAKNDPSGGTFKSTGRKIPGKEEENLILWVLKQFQEKTPIPSPYIHLHKSIPIGAGLGGGSADAGYFLRALTSIYPDHFSQNDLQETASKAGSDVPFFLQDHPCVAKGKGELLERIPLDLGGYYLLLVIPDIFISTGEAYKMVEPSGSGHYISEKIVNLPPAEWSGVISNDFEEPILRTYPKIREIKEVMQKKGAFYTSLSGSGSSYYGLFQNKPTLSGDEFDGMKVWMEELPSISGPYNR